jgi:hypothetical protein
MSLIDGGVAMVVVAVAAGAIVVVMGVVPMVAAADAVKLRA